MGSTKHRTQNSTAYKSNNSSRRRKEADIISNKIMAAFSIAFIGTFGIMFLRNRVASQGPTTMIGLKILILLGALIFAAGIVLFIRQKKQRNPEQAYWFVFMALAGIAASVCAVLLLFVGYKISGFLSVILPIAAIYYFLYTVFVREGFVVLSLCGLSAALYWYSSTSLLPRSALWIGLYAAFLVILAAVFITALIERSGRSVFKFGKREFKLLSSNGRHIWLYLTLALLTAGLVVSFVLGSTTAYVLMFVSIAYLLISVVGMMIKVQ